MAEKSRAESIIEYLCATRADRIHVLTRDMRDPGMPAELEPMRFLFWWMRSYLAATQICPDLTLGQLLARRYLLRVVETLMITDLQDTLPVPGLSWNADQRAREIRERERDTLHRRPRSLTERIRNWLKPPPGGFDMETAAEVGPGMLAAWKDEESRYAGWPLTVELVRTIEFYHMKDHGWDPPG